MAYEQTGNEYGRAGTVTNPPALTSTVAAGTTPTKAEFDALRADVDALRTAVADLITALRGANIVD
jgi:polyhydroxyalkanoate synthesis regulator phasin